MDIVIKLAPYLFGLVVMIFLTSWGIYFRRQIRNFLDKVTNLQLRRGKTELSLSQHPEPVVSKQLLASGEEASPPKPVTDETKEIKKLDSEGDGDWFVKFVDAFKSRNRAEFEEAYKHIQESETNATERLKMKAVYLGLRYGFGDETALSELQDLAKETAVAGTAYFWLGASYERSHLFSKAVEAYKLSAHYSEAGYKSTGVNAAAQALLKGEKKAEAFSFIMQEIGKTKNEKDLGGLYEGLANLYNEANDHELRALALEKSLEYKPTDTSNHFQAGWSYSQEETRASGLAILHYRAALSFNPKDSAALNNLGVQFGRLDMNINSVENYDKAFELGDTLAAANLAYLYLREGFAKRAEEIIAKARTKEDAHPNVGKALAAIADKKEAEEKILKEQLESAGAQRLFFLPFGEAYFTEKPSPPSFEGTWLAPDEFELTIKQTENTIESGWEAGGNTYTLRGTVSNRAARISVSYVKSYTTHVHYEYAYLSENGEGLHIMSTEGKTPLVREFKKKVLNI